MAIKPICDKCKKELIKFSGILFSPPDESNTVKKFHICKACYADIVKPLGISSGALNVNSVDITMVYNILA